MRTPHQDDVVGTPDIRPLVPGWPPPVVAHRERIVAHPDTVNALVVLDDGVRCVSASEADGTLAVSTLAPLAVVDRLVGHDGPVNTLAVTAGGLLVSGGDDHTVRIWDVAARRAVRVLRGRTGHVREVATAAGVVVSRAEDDTVRVWDLATGGCRHVLDGHREDVMTVAVSPDGRLAASASMDNALHVWDLERGTRLHTLYDDDGIVGMVGRFYLSLPGAGSSGGGHSSCPAALVFTPDGGGLLSLGDEIIRWDLHTGRERDRLPRQDWTAKAMAVRPDGRHTAVAGSGIHVWAGEGPEARRVAVLDVGGKGVRAVAYTPDGTTLVAGADDGTVTTWPGDPDPAATLAGQHPAYVTQVVVAPGGRRAASNGSDSSVRLWDLGDGRCLAALEHDLHGPGRPVAFSPDGSRLVTVGDEHLHVVDTTTGTEIRRVHRKGERPDAPCAVVVLPDGNGLLAGHYREFVHWDLTGADAHRAFTGRTRGISDVAVSADGRWAVTLGFMNPPDVTEETLRSLVEVLQCWDVAAGALVWTEYAHREPESWFGPGFSMLALDPAGRCLVTCSGRAGHTLVGWEVATGAVRWELALPEGSPTDAHHWLDGDTLLVATRSGSGGSVHQVDTGRGALRRTVALRDVHDLVFLPDGRGVVAVHDRAVKLVRLADGQVRAQTTVDTPIRSVAVSDDGRTVLVGDDSGQVHPLRVTLPDRAAAGVDPW